RDATGDAGDGRGYRAVDSFRHRRRRGWSGGTRRLRGDTGRHWKWHDLMACRSRRHHLTRSEAEAVPAFRPRIRVAKGDCICKQKLDTCRRWRLIWLNSPDSGGSRRKPACGFSLMERHMYKNLLVNIPTERSPQPVIDGAISLAARCQAQLDAVSVGYES